MAKKKVLVTGAFGTIGGALHCRLSDNDHFDVYATDRRETPRDDLMPEWTPHVPADKFVRGDLADLETARKTVKEMDSVVHLAANANPNSEFDTILHSNVHGTYNVFEACRLEGVKRVVYASSIMTSFGYYSQEPYKSIWDDKPDETIPIPLPKVSKDQPVWPTEPYSASKVWGEALARAFALKYDTSFHCIRIGAVNKNNMPGKSMHRYRSVWCAIEDITQLIESCIIAPDSIKFDIFYGISNNRYRWVDTEYAQETIGYTPQHCAEKVLGLE